MRLRTLVVCLIFAVPAAAQQIVNANVQRVDASRGVAAAVRSVAGSGTSWVAWSAQSGGKTICCWNGSECCGRCSLSGNRSITMTDRRVPPTSDMLVVVRLEDGDVRRVRAFDAGCEVDGEGATIHMLANAPVESGIEFLISALRDAASRKGVVATLAMHEHPRVVPELIALARNHDSKNVRRDAIFWLGQKAGDKAAGELRRAVDEDPDEDVRKHAVFAISQLPRERAVPMLIDLVKTHKSRKVRERAMFWLAQTGDPRAIDLMEEILLR